MDRLLLVMGLMDAAEEAANVEAFSAARAAYYAAHEMVRQMEGDFSPLPLSDYNHHRFAVMEYMRGVWEGFEV